MANGIQEEVYWGGGGELLGKVPLVNKKRKTKVNILDLLVIIVFTYDAKNCYSYLESMQGTSLTYQEWWTEKMENPLAHGDVTESLYLLWACFMSELLV